MASREQRRNAKKQKDQQDQKTSVDRQRERNPVLYTFAVIIVFIIIIAFIGTGMGGSQGPSYAKRVFGEYNGRIIEHIEGSPFYDYQRTYGNLLQQYNPQGDSAMLTRQAVQYGFSQTIQLYATADKAEKSGYHVSEDTVNRAAVASAYYKDSRTNRYSDTLYMNTHPLVKDNILDSIRDQLLGQYYASDLQGIPQLSTKEVEFLKSSFGTERSVNFVSFSYSEYPEDKVKEYGETNKKNFRSAGFKRITLRDSSIEQAQEIAALYNTKQSEFDALAVDKSSDSYASAGGDMGKQYFYAIKNIFGDNEEAEKLAEQIFAATLNEVTAPIPQGESWILFLRTTEVEEVDMNNEADFSTIKEYIRSYDNNVITEYVTTRAEDFKKSADAQGLDEAAAAIGTEVATTNYFPLNYLNVLNDKTIEVEGESEITLPSVSNNADFFETVFSLKEGEVSEPVILGEAILVMSLAGEKKVTDEEWVEYSTQSEGSIPTVTRDIANELSHPYFAYSLVLNGFNSDFSRSIVDQQIKAELDANFETNFQRYFVGGSQQ